MIDYFRDRQNGPVARTEEAITPLCLSEYNLLEEATEDEVQDPFTLRLIRAIADQHGLIRGNALHRPIEEEMQACLRLSAQGELGTLGIMP